MKYFIFHLLQKTSTIFEKGKELSMGTKFYVQSNQGFNEQYNTILKKFDSEVQKVDFKDKKNTVEKINRWVSDRTDGNIQNFVKEGRFNFFLNTVFAYFFNFLFSFSENIGKTIMMLISALYFKGNWKNPFEEQFTSLRDFFLPNGTKIATPCMFLHALLPYAESTDLEAKALKLDYDSDHYSMIILLPNQGIDELLQKLPSFDLKRLQFTEKEIRAAIPKFKFEYAIDL